MSRRAEHPTEQPGTAFPEIELPDGEHCVHRWRHELATRVGLSEAEIEAMVAQLEQYCDRHGVVASRLLWSWDERVDLTLRRRLGSTGTPNLAVESFLIHNGVNVFGDLVCVPGRPEDLADQGPQFMPFRP